MFKLTGTLKVVNDTVQVSEKFSKRDFVLTDSNGMYPQDISFQMTQDKCPVMDQFAEGETVEVSFNIKGREWTSPQGEVKYFNSLEAWRVESSGSQSSTPPPVAAQVEVAAADDDLPF